MKPMTIAALVLLSGITAASAQYSPYNNPQNDPQQQQMLLNGEQSTPPGNQCSHAAQLRKS